MAEEEQHDLFNDDSVLSNLEQVDQVSNLAWPETLREMVSVLSHLLQQQYTLSAEASQKQAQDCVVTIARHFGGRPVYLPVGKRLEQALRNNAIWQDYNGRNINELVSKYGLSHQQIYTITEKQRAIEFNKRQTSLPFDETLSD